MSNYDCNSVSNYFKVKDLEKFKTQCRILHIQLENKAGCEPTGDDMVALVGPDRFGFENDYLEDEIEGIPIDSPFFSRISDQSSLTFDPMKFISTHLQEGEVCVIMSIGNEKLRSMAGMAEAVNHEGDVVYINLNSIYENAAKVFGVPLNTIDQI